MTDLPRQFGKYELIAELGEGGMARVYRAVRAGPMGFRKEVAIKQIRPHVAREKKLVKALINEARLGGYLRHRNVVEAHELDHVDDVYYIAMEYVDGFTLHAVLARTRRRGPLPRAAIGAIALQLCEGLAYAHDARDAEGRPMDLVHRDLKPGNVMVSRDGVVKIMDFGIAKSAVNLFQTTTANITKGTPVYMSPEQVDGLPLDRRSDLFALGSVLAEMITGEVVFECTQLYHTLGRIARADTREILDRVGAVWPAMAPVLYTAMQRDPLDRYASAAEMATDLRAVMAGEDEGFELGPWLAEWMGEGDGDSSGISPIARGQLGPEVGAEGADGDAHSDDPGGAGDAVSSLDETTPGRRVERGKPVPPGRRDEPPPPSAYSPVSETMVFVSDDADRAAERSDRSLHPLPAVRPRADGDAPESDALISTSAWRGRRGRPLLALAAVGLAGLAVAGFVALRHVVPGATDPGGRAGGEVASAAARAGNEDDRPPPASPYERGGEVIDAVGYPLIRVEPARFAMGSPDEEPGRERGEQQHPVELTSAYLLGAHEVTQQLWTEVVGARSLRAAHRGGELPVEQVSWLEAVRLCNRLSEREGLEKAYVVRKGGTVEWKRESSGYRLPTEAEWEYAARGDHAGTLAPDVPTGSVARYGGTRDTTAVCAHGNVADATALRGWPTLTPFPCDDGHETTAPVGSFEPNAFGLYDVTGNVAEWVWDRYAPFEATAAIDPTGPDEGDARVHRGGSWSSAPRLTRLAARGRAPPTQRADNLGFRLARSAP